MPAVLHVFKVFIAIFSNYSKYSKARANTQLHTDRWWAAAPSEKNLNCMLSSDRNNGPLGN